MPEESDPFPAAFELGIGADQVTFEALICGLPIEIVSGYRPDGTQAFAPVQGEADRVPLPARSEGDLTGATIVHNHTELRAVSDSDLRSAAIRSARGIVVVLPEGTALRLSVATPQDWPLEEALDRNDEAWRLARHRVGEDSGHPSWVDRLHEAVIDSKCFNSPRSALSCEGMPWDRESEIDDLSNYVREVSARLCLDLKWREVDSVVAEARSVADARQHIDERLGKLAVQQSVGRSFAIQLEDGETAVSIDPAAIYAEA